MKILDNSDKHLLTILPGIITEKLNKEAVKIKFIGGGSYGRVYKVFLSDGETIAVKGYKLSHLWLMLDKIFFFCYNKNER